MALSYKKVMDHFRIPVMWVRLKMLTALVKPVMPNAEIL